MLQPPSFPWLRLPVVQGAQGWSPPAGGRPGTPRHWRRSPGSPMWLSTRHATTCPAAGRSRTVREGRPLGRWRSGQCRSGTGGSRRCGAPEPRTRRGRSAGSQAPARSRTASRRAAPSATPATPSRCPGGPALQRRWRRSTPRSAAGAGAGPGPASSRGRAEAGWSGTARAVIPEPSADDHVGMEGVEEPLELAV